jgi:hypothetical protein
MAKRVSPSVVAQNFQAQSQSQSLTVLVSSSGSFTGGYSPGLGIHIPSRAKSVSSNSNMCVAASFASSSVASEAFIARQTLESFYSSLSFSNYTRVVVVVVVVVGNDVKCPRDGDPGLVDARAHTA